MANQQPLGDASWLAYLDERRRTTSHHDLEWRVKTVELYKSGINAEPSSLKLWLAYCEYFWSLFNDASRGAPGWSEEEQQLGRELFAFNTALSLWSDGYDAIKYRINDSHEFWNRWISIEQEQLARSRSPVGVERITYLFRDRLQTPHATWDETAQMFSAFLSTYNNAAYESEFQDITKASKPARDAYAERERRELELKQHAGEAYKDAMREYLDWEIVQVTKSNPRNSRLAVSLALGLFARALTDTFTFDEDIWQNYVVFISSLKDQSDAPDTLNVLQRATTHCPWSGSLWSRYILAAEEAGWGFHDIEAIKHAATNAKALDRNGMTSVIDMYAAWCGYLKRTALNPNAHDDAVDIADVGLVAALEDVQLWGERLYNKDYRGDPNYRLERIRIQFLTEKKGEIDEARRQWKHLASHPLHNNSYDFWLNYYLWEMLIYSSQPKPRSPTPATPAAGAKPVSVPSLATEVLLKALAQKGLDWPERVIEICQQHVNDYEQPVTLRRALDRIHKTRRSVENRRARERKEAEAAYAAAQQQPGEGASSKRKRAETIDESTEGAKRPRNNQSNGTEATKDEQAKRDRENTSVMVQHLPADATQTALRKYFKDYGKIITVTLESEADGNSKSALIEFETPEDMTSALLRDQKYYNQSQITVKPGGGLTIYVTNYPPTADEAYIRDLFKGCGDIFGIRFPSLKYNTHRRFCYISFKNTKGAANATKLDGKVLDGEYKLLAKYSDPAAKKRREGGVSEGRELFVRNIDFKTTQEDLQALFSKYGKVDSINILKNMKGVNRGSAFVTMETKEQAQSALELDKTKFGARILDVEVAKDKNYKPIASNRAGSASASPAPSDDPSREEIQARTMALLGLPDTVNDARVRSIAEKHGSIVKVVLRPDHEGAIIEYADVGSVGKAMLELSGHEITPGTRVRTGTVDQLFQEKQPKKKQLMPPPHTIRRPGGATGKPKARAGFAGGISAAASDDTSGKPKSNADFKALFLGEKK